MVEIINRKNYNKSLLKTTLWILAGFVVTIFLNPSFFVVAIILSIIIELIFLSEKYTERVSVDDINTTIVFHRFFSKKEMVINKSETRSKLSKVASFRGSAYWVLDIMQHKKRIYRIDSRDGFGEDDLIMLDNSLKSTQ